MTTIRKRYLKLILKSNDVLKLEKVIKKIISMVRKEGVNVRGPVPLPNKRKVFTLIRSPHIFKKSREQFEIIKHSRLLFIEFDPRLTEKFTTCSFIPSGVDAEINVSGLNMGDEANGTE